MDRTGDYNRDAAVGAPVQRFVSKDKRMQLPDKCLAYGLTGCDEILKEAESITVSSRLQMILDRKSVV